MVLRIDAAGDSDTGQIRQANEDAFLLGDSVFAVADGMGGHVAGEIASATALEPIKELDGRVFPDPSTAIGKLREAVLTANVRVAEKAADDPNYRGMGTTLTAALLEGRRVHFAHVGDSRAYLLRDGQLSQLTDDHTLVQHLVDEGQITREEAASHPQRSIITRAIGVSHEIEVDSMSLDLVPGDHILLCSDGLTGVLPDEKIASTLTADTELDTAVRDLINAANAEGGPDNITVVVLRYGEVSESVAGTGTATGASGADGGGNRGDGDNVTEEDTPPETGQRVVVRSAQEIRDDDWAQRLGRFGNLSQERDRPFDDEGDHRPGRWQRGIAVGIALLVLLALAVGGGRWLLSRSYYVGLDGDQVVIYQGVPNELGPLELSWVAEETTLTTEEVLSYWVADLRDGILAVDLNDARLIVENAPLREDESETAGSTDASDDATEEPAPTPQPSPTATVTPQP